MVRPTGQAAKSLGEVNARHHTSTVALSRTSDGFEHSEYAYETSGDTRWCSYDRQPVA
jgi:hypothetical protein